MTIQEFRDYMASGKPVVGGGDVHMMFHQLCCVAAIGYPSYVSNLQVYKRKIKNYDHTRIS